MATQMLWKFVGIELYSHGIAIFELTAILCMMLLPHKKATKIEHSQLMFFGICAGWDFIKYLFFDPYALYFFDYISTPLSLIITLIFTYVSRNNTK